MEPAWGNVSMLKRKKKNRRKRTRRRKRRKKGEGRIRKPGREGRRKTGMEERKKRGEVKIEISLGKQHFSGYLNSRGVEKGKICC